MIKIIVTDQVTQHLPNPAAALDYINGEEGLIQIQSWSAEDGFGDSAQSLADYCTLKLMSAAARVEIRSHIEHEAGDTQSILGTVCDGAQLILLQLAKLAQSLSTATTLAEVRAAAQPLADLTADFLSKVESGEVKLTVAVKGEANVLTDIESRSTAVTNVITGAAQ